MPGRRHGRARGARADGEVPRGTQDRLGGAAAPAAVQGRGGGLAERGVGADDGARGARARPHRGLARQEYLSSLYALQTCAKQVDKFQRPWVKDARRDGSSPRAPDRDASVGVGLLRPGIDDLSLRLACNGVEAEARHGGAADVLVSHGALKLLDDIIKVRDAAVVATVAGALASLLQQVGSRPCDDATRDTCKDVADRLLSLVWPLSLASIAAGAAAGSPPSRKRHDQNWGGCARRRRRRASSGRRGPGAGASDRPGPPACTSCGGGALDALAARRPPTATRDEVFGARVDDSHLGLEEIGTRRRTRCGRPSARGRATCRPSSRSCRRSRASPCTRRRTPPPGAWRGPCPSWAPSTGRVGAGTSRRARACGGWRPQAATRGDAFFGLRAGDDAPDAAAADVERRRRRDAARQSQQHLGARCAPISRTSGASARRRASARAASMATKRGRRAALVRSAAVASIDADLGAGSLLLRLAARDVDAAGALGRARGAAGVHLDVEAFCARAAGAPPARARREDPLRPVHPVAARAARGGRGDRRPRERHRRVVGGAREAVPGARRRAEASSVGAPPARLPGGRRPDGPRH